MDEMRSANQHEIVLNYENFDTFSMSLRPDYFVPLRDYCVWGSAFGLWYLNTIDNKGREGAVEPPEDVKANAPAGSKAAEAKADGNVKPPEIQPLKPVTTDDLSLDDIGL